jgi:hypothetical protein
MRKNKAPTSVTLAIFTTITVFAWIFFDIYRILRKTPVINVEPKILEPVNPNLDQSTLNKIGERKYFEESALNSIVPTALPTPEELPQPTTAPATESAEQIQ